MTAPSPAEIVKGLDAAQKRANIAVVSKDIQSLAVLLEKTGGKAWEPPAPRYPWIVKMIDAGFLKRCDMRCGFEAFKDTGLRFTDAGILALTLLENSHE
jgi:hypothetical protein